MFARFIGAGLLVSLLLVSGCHHTSRYSANCAQPGCAQPGCPQPGITAASPVSPPPGYGITNVPPPGTAPAVVPGFAH